MQLLEGPGTLRFSSPLLCRPVSLCKVTLHKCSGRSEVLLLGTREACLSATEAPNPVEALAVALTTPLPDRESQGLCNETHYLT